MTAPVPAYVAATAAFAVLASLATPSVAAGEENGGLFEVFDKWHIFGSTTVRAEHIEVYGENTDSQFPFTGPQFFVEADLNARLEVSPYESLSLQLSPIYNESEYRLVIGEGLEFERFNVTWEKGDAALPFRLQVGDYFGQISPRTLAQPLQGAEIDVQPQWGDSGQRHSLLLFSGRTADLYREIDVGRDIFSGASYLFLDPRFGSWALNAVHNYREDDTAAGFGDRNQLVLSLAGEKDFRLEDQALTFETEVAWFQGDHTDTGNEITDKHDFGYAFELRGRDLDAPLTYSFLYERYGEDYRPNGRTIAANRQSLEFRAGWRFDNGLSLRGRLQHFSDNIDEGVQLDTSVVGFNLGGPLLGNWWPGLNGFIDAFIQGTDNETDTVNSATYSINANFNAPISENVQARMALGYVETANHKGPNTEQASLTLGADVGFAFDGWLGTVSPGFRMVRSWGNNNNRLDFGPDFIVAVSKDRHSAEASYQLLSQEVEDQGAIDSLNHVAAASYTYNLGPHRFGVDAEAESRQPSPGRDTHAWRVGAFYTFSFDRPPRTEEADTGLPFAASTVRASAVVAEADGIDIAGLPPGMEIDKAIANLAASGITGESVFVNSVVYEVSGFRQIDQRQRLALLKADERITKSGIVIDLQEDGDQRRAEDILNRVQGALARRYGPPTFTFREGQFDNTFPASVNAGTFIRIFEWAAEAGVIRLGIPRRLDRQVRIEVQYAKRFPPPEQTLWSLSTIR